MAKASQNPAYNQTMQQLRANNAPQIAEAKKLDQSYQQSKKPITPIQTSRAANKKLSYRPGASAGENWSK